MPRMSGPRAIKWSASIWLLAIVSQIMANSQLIAGNPQQQQQQQQQLRPTVQTTTIATVSGQDLQQQPNDTRETTVSEPEFESATLVLDPETLVLTSTARPRVEQPPTVARATSVAATTTPTSASTTTTTTTSTTTTSSPKPLDLNRLIPSGETLFDRDSVDASQFKSMDCHLRNIDYCLAGLIGSSQRLLPETDEQFELRCDEMRATSSCLAIYNEKCQTFRVFSALMPVASLAGRSDISMDELSRQLSGPESVFSKLEQNGDQLLGEAQRNSSQQLVSQILLNRQQQRQQQQPNGNGESPLKASDLMEACEPRSRRSSRQRLIRRRLFELARCVNARMPKLSPCIEDLKTALQLFYEPRRSLPMKPSCCALSRFRQCAEQALDRVCGLSSISQLLEQLGGGVGGGGGAQPGSSSRTIAGPVAMVGAINKACGRQAVDHRSAYCQDVLPPSGLSGPQRRGQKASKLAKALELFAFAPATQDSNSGYSLG